MRTTRLFFPGFCLLLGISFFIPALYSQTADSSAASILLKPPQGTTIVKQDTLKKRPEITMPAYRSRPVRNRTLDLDAAMSSRAGDIKYDDPNARFQKPAYDEIRITPEYPLPPGVPEIPKPDPMRLQDYTLPTRDEYEVLRVLWLKEDVMDTTLYSCVDTTLNVTMSGLNQILEEMTRKKLVIRQQVSPRFEFNAFGVPIEMSRKNLRNKVYVYQSLVDQEKLKYFIDAAKYGVSQDSSMLKQKRLRAAQNDDGLLKVLNQKSLMENQK